MRYLGIDYGDKRIGLAVSDDEARFAVPYDVIEEQSIDASIKKIQSLVREEGITTIVVGIPLSLGKRTDPPKTLRTPDIENVQMQRVQQFIAQLRTALFIPIETIDERLSTVEAERRMKGAPKNVRAQKDAVAASIILQSYLDRASSASLAG
ncbi:Holliday junction resolvase RuvX [Candidatus Uhrbacteria bacterium]|nr:Holliday junction resolvase RuvX [Candidatus Uhrbacteria bacterium]